MLRRVVRSSSGAVVGCSARCASSCSEVASAQCTSSSTTTRPPRVLRGPVEQRGDRVEEPQGPGPGVDRRRVVQQRGEQRVGVREVRRDGTDDLRPRPQRRSHVTLVALPDHGRQPSLGGLVQHLLDEPGLADTGLTQHADDSRPGGSQGRHQLADPGQRRLAAEQHPALAGRRPRHGCGCGGGGRRGRGDGPVERAVLAQEALLEPLQVRGGVDAELVGEPVTHRAKRGQGLRLPPAAVLRQRPAGPRAARGRGAARPGGSAAGPPARGGRDRAAPAPARSAAAARSSTSRVRTAATDSASHPAYGGPVHSASAVSCSARASDGSGSVRHRVARSSNCQVSTSSVVARIA